MAKRSSTKDPSVSQMYDTGCSWQLYRMFNFHEGQAKRFVSNMRHSNVHAIGNGNSKTRRSNALTMVDEKYPHNHFVSSKRTRDYGCRSISCVKNDHIVAVQRNEAPEMVVDQNFINGKYVCKDGEVSQPHQFLDALHILYSNKQLFLKLLQDPSSLLVKKIYDSQILEVNEQYQSETPYAGCHCPLHSYDSYGYNLQIEKPSHSPFSHIKRKLWHVMGVRKKEHQWVTTDDLSRKFPCGCQTLGEGDEVRRLESVGRNSIRSDHYGFANVGKLKRGKKKKKKIRDFTFCIGQSDVSVGESCGSNLTRTSVSHSEQNIHNNIHDEAMKNLSEILECRIEETNNNEPLGPIAKRVSNELLCSDNNLHTHFGIPIGPEKLITEMRDMDMPCEQDNKIMDSPRQSFDGDIITVERIGSAMDSPQDIRDPSFSPEVASSSCSSSQNVDDHILNQLLSTEYPVQLVHDEFEEQYVADLTKSSWDSMDMLSLKWDELVKKKCGTPDQMLDPSTFEELKGLSNQLCGSTILYDCVKEVFMEAYQNFCSFSLQCSIINPNIKACVLKRTMVNEVKQVINLYHHPSPETLEQLAEKDLSRFGSWLNNVEADIKDIAVEVGEDVLQTLILEILSEMDMKSEAS
ncbi:uncharacterized protein G2W53_019432 [Senna tora]|uniref:DUF4378 domain-containing protein n=1 Tax=Senna tora TaxID=362788 RepID=A0A834TTL5_9FABA|nr:uncharacterized protein G2W53_019432 [Senna tora]